MVLVAWSRYLCSIDPTMRNAMAGLEAVALTKQTDVGYYVRVSRLERPL